MRVRGELASETVQAQLPYLDLFVVTDGSNGRGPIQRARGGAGPELDHRLGPSHQARHRTAVLDQLLLLFLQEGQKVTFQTEAESF